MYNSRTAWIDIGWYQYWNLGQYADIGYHQLIALSHTFKLEIGYLEFPQVHIFRLLEKPRENQLRHRVHMQTSRRKAPGQESNLRPSCEAAVLSDCANRQSQEVLAQQLHASRRQEIRSRQEIYQCGSYWCYTPGGPSTTHTRTQTHTHSHCSSMPASRHLRSRHCWHLRRMYKSISQWPLFLQEYWALLMTLRRKKPLQPSQLSTL